MRVWDVDLQLICNVHLNAMHKEIHQIRSSILSGNGWRHHPEVKRWRGHLRALGVVHDAVVCEMRRRGKFRNHSTEFGEHDDDVHRPAPWQPVAVQMERLREKRETIQRCQCLNERRGEQQWLITTLRTASTARS